MSFVFVKVIALFKRKQMSAGFLLLFVYICIVDGDPMMPLSGLTLPHICPCPKPRPGFPMPLYVVLNGLRAVRFVDTGGIVDHH
jgi:hypothetical protein